MGIFGNSDSNSDNKFSGNFTGEFKAGPFEAEIPRLAERVGSIFGDEGREAGREIDRNTDDIKIKFKL